MALKIKPTFTDWKKLVDLHLVQLCGMVSDDLPDFCYADAYSAGRSPMSVARAALRAARDF